MLYTLMKRIEERFTFSKTERLTGTKRIDSLFKQGESFISYPLRVIYLIHEQTTVSACSILVSVPKKRIKKAVHRNRIKRLIRESYRLDKQLIDLSSINSTQIDIAFIYVNDTTAEFLVIQKAMQKALKQISKRFQKTEQSE